VRPKVTSKPAPPLLEQAALLDTPIFFSYAQPNTPFLGRYAPVDGHWLTGAIAKPQLSLEYLIVKQNAFERQLEVRLMQSAHVPEAHSITFTDIPTIVDHIKHLSNPVL
jgi:hypothetical protein